MDTAQLRGERGIGCHGLRGVNHERYTAELRLENGAGLSAVILLPDNSDVVHVRKDVHSERWVGFGEADHGAVHDWLEGEAEEQGAENIALADSFRAADDWAVVVVTADDEVSLEDVESVEQAAESVELRVAHQNLVDRKAAQAVEGVGAINENAVVLLILTEQIADLVDDLLSAHLLERVLEGAHGVVVGQMRIGGKEDLCSNLDEDFPERERPDGVVLLGDGDQNRLTELAGDIGINAVVDNVLEEGHEIGDVGR